MIVVIADDLTGAAELGGLALRFDLKTEVSTRVPLHSDADILILATDTRSVSQQDAEDCMASVTRQVMALQPKLIFKKVDSVLRGHVTAELDIQLKVLNLPRVLLVPANPRLGRTIENGIYFLKGEPLHLSGFSGDPEFAIKSSCVTDMLAASSLPVHVLKKEDDITPHGILVGEASAHSDLCTWAERASENLFIAGAAEFFESILELITGKKAGERKVNASDIPAPELIVCGSAFGRSKEAIKSVQENGGPVSYMPVDVIQLMDADDDKGFYGQWTRQIIKLFAEYGKAVIAIDPSDLNENTGNAASLRLKTAMIVEKVFDLKEVKELLIEGGSTASAILGQLGLSDFVPVKELAPGVIRMASKERAGLFVTMKPGSYTWPGYLWNF